MAGFHRRQARRLATLSALLAALLLASLPSAHAQLYEQPMLVIDPGMHTGQIPGVGVDAAGTLAATGSHDKTVRLWSLADGRLLRTIRMPAGPGDIGKIYAVAVSPDGDLVAAGGWTAYGAEQFIYLFDAHTGRMIKRISGLRDVTLGLAFSPNGRYLAAGLGSWEGLRVYDRDRQWAEAFRDTEYEGQLYGVAFAADGRLATTSLDGKIRLYDSDFKGTIVPPQETVQADHPLGIAFSPDGATLAVGYADAPTVDLFDGHSLKPLAKPDLEGVDIGSLSKVTWSRDGKTLYAGGRFGQGGSYPVLAWTNAGRGERRALPAGTNTIGGVAALPDGRVFVAAVDPLVAVLEPDGRRRWAHLPPIADFRGQRDVLSVSSDGTVVDFGFEQWGESPLRFDLGARKLSHDPASDERTAPARLSGLAIEGWKNAFFPTVDGNAIQLDQFERSRSVAVHPDGNRFVLGADWYLRAFDATGKLLWRRDVPGTAWAVNITGDGRLVVVGYDDGTIRWHRMDDGREVLALFVLKDKQNWVAWSPEGFYGATPGAFGVLRWQANRGIDAAAETVPVSDISSLRRPDALPFILQELETARALGIADIKAARGEVWRATKSAKPPGGRLHVLAIGISNYGDKAKNLTLKFAQQDARDVAGALINTQGGGLYAEVMPQFLPDDMASKAGIFDGLTKMGLNMRNGTGQDLAIVMFSGHGTVIDGQFYLVPYGVDTSTADALQAAAIPASEFQGKISKLAAYGRVLVLLDACRSAGLLPNADTLKSLLDANNVTVLTSSTADKLSREDDRWQHGAFTKVLLDALSAPEIDTDKNGVISMTELTEYIGKHLAELTDYDQQLGLAVRFRGDIFVANY